MSTFDEAQWLANEELRALAQPTYLVGMSGPPRSGKDSIGVALVNILIERHNMFACHRALSMPMRKTIYAMIGKDYTLDHYESTKDIPLPELGGKSIRRAMIGLSEEHVKPTYGHGFWGSALLNTLPIPQGARVVVVTDVGFDSEVKVFEDAFGADRCVWAQVTRPGCTFAGDSRSYVGSTEYRTSVINEGESFEQVTTAAEQLYKRLITDFGWELPTAG